MSANNTKGQVEHRKLMGTVVSARMSKTVVVRVDRSVRHPKYGKTYTVSRKYHVHDENGVAKPGDLIEFVAARPLSSTKRWRYSRTITAAPVAAAVEVEIIETKS